MYAIRSYYDDYAKEILYKSLGKAEADEVLAKLSRMKLASQSFSYLDRNNFV